MATISDKNILINLSNKIKQNTFKLNFNQKILNTNNGSIWKITKNLLEIKNQYPPLTRPNETLDISYEENTNLFGTHLAEIFFCLYRYNT